MTRFLYTQILFLILIDIKYDLRSFFLMWVDTKEYMGSSHIWACHKPNPLNAKVPSEGKQTSSNQIIYILLTYLKTVMHCAVIYMLVLTVNLFLTTCCINIAFTKFHTVQQIYVFHSLYFSVTLRV